MNYRKFGNTGEQISALGFGCMRFPEYEQDGKHFVDQDKVDKMIETAYEKGVNYFDTAPYYCNKNSEAALGKAVKKFRDKILVSTKLPLEVCKKEGDLRRQLESSLKNLDMDYVDFYHFWGINKNSFDNIIMEQDLLKDMQKCKEEGLIRHISFSFHDDPMAIKYIIDKSIERGIPLESMLCQYNLIDRSNEEMLKYAQSKGLGTVAMGPVGGGRLAAPTEMTAKLTNNSNLATYALAFKFCLGNPDLNCALSGMQTLEMVEQNTDLASDSTGFSEAEWKQLGDSLETLKKFNDLYCTGCKYCQPCPVGINIPHIFNMYTYFNVYGLKDHARHMYKEYVSKDGKLKKDCLNCGKCEKACPQHLKIRDELERVENIINA